MILRLGVDLGGTKMESVVLDADARELVRRRTPTPHSGYDVALQTLAQFILDAEAQVRAPCSVGVGMPGTIAPRSGRVVNAYNTPFNGRRLKHDLEQKLGRETRFANDANCFALSEAVDGAGHGAETVFGGILGTGAGGGIALARRVLNGRHGIAGEWGHTPLPWMTPQEYPGPRCFCGRDGCIEQFVAGPALNRDKHALGDAAALPLWEDRLARALSAVVNILDPDVIVLGGGLSNIEHIYTVLPELLPKYVYTSAFDTPIVRALHGDASGVRGAAMLWP